MANRRVLEPDEGRLALASRCSLAATGWCIGARRSRATRRCWA